MSTTNNTISWLPHAVAEAAVDGGPTADSDLPAAWDHLLAQLKSASEVVLGSGAARNARDTAAGLRHLLVLLGLGIDEALRFEPDPAPRVTRTNTDDALTWGMECPDCVYHRATLRSGESYRIVGNRGTARYVGLQTMDGIAATANVLVDELDVDPEGNFELVLSAEEHPGNWMPITGDHPVFIVRHFFYDWDSEVPSVLKIVQLDGAPRAGTPVVPLELAVPRQLGAIGDFVKANLEFFHEWGNSAPANGFLPVAQLSSIGAAAENRPVIGRWELAPGQALIMEVQPPQGVYWSFSVGNPWWETIHYGRHQSSLNGHQAEVDPDGKVRVVLSERDPGVANWLDTAGFSNGAMILRCVRTDDAPVPTTTVVDFDDVGAALPPETRRVDPDERRSVIAARRRAVAERFGR